MCAGVCVCMCVCVCMYVRAYVRAFICVYVRARAMCACVRVFLAEHAPGYKKDKQINKLKKITSDSLLQETETALIQLQSLHPPPESMKMVLLTHQYQHSGQVAVAGWTYLMDHAWAVVPSAHTEHIYEQYLFYSTNQYFPHLMHMGFVAENVLTITISSFYQYGFFLKLFQQQSSNFTSTCSLSLTIISNLCTKTAH